MGSAWPKSGGPRSSRAVMAVVAAVVSGLLMASCSTSPAPTAPGASAGAGRPAATSRPGGVISLNAISTLRSVFNRADGHTRLVLIFSPT
jgi:hypothetical protein